MSIVVCISTTGGGGGPAVEAWLGRAQVVHGQADDLVGVGGTKGYVYFKYFRINISLIFI